MLNKLAQAWFCVKILNTICNRLLFGFPLAFQLQMKKFHLLSLSADSYSDLMTHLNKA
jgi:hypothetical protein